MDIQITIGQLINILLIVAGGGVLVVLLKTLMNVNNVVNDIGRIIQRNEENIDDILDSVPRILDNTEKITESVHEEMEHVSQAIKAIEETVEYTASAAQVVAEDVALPMKDVLAVLKTIKDIFTKDKKKVCLKINRIILNTTLLLVRLIGLLAFLGLNNCYYILDRKNYINYYLVF